MKEALFALTLDFDWDSNKASINQHKHGISFAEASQVFFDPLAITVFDAEHSDYEERWHTLGCSAQGRLLLVAHTFQSTGPMDAKIRLISARPTTRREKRLYADEPRS